MKYKYCDLKTALKDWNSGQLVHTINCGGLGFGYEKKKP